MQPEIPTPSFDHGFTMEEMRRVAAVLKGHPHVQSVGSFGTFVNTDAAHTLRFVVEVDDEALFIKFSECFKKEAGDQDMAVESRIAAVSYTLGDDLLARVDACFGNNYNAGNFIDIVIVPPHWRDRVDFVQSRLPFDDISIGDFIDARDLTMGS